MSLATGVKNALRTTLYRSGILGGWHRWRNRRALTVLMFHRVLPADAPAFSLAEREFTFTLDGFRRTLDFVRHHYHVVSLADLQAVRQGGRALPSNPLLITFDDGWRDTLVHALPELECRGMPSVLFLASEVVALDGLRWWQDALVAALAEAGAPVRLSAAAGLAHTPPLAVTHALAAHLAAMPEAQRRAWLEQHAPGILSQLAERQMVTLHDLCACTAANMAIGGHGHTHGPLTLSSDAKSELSASRSMLDQLGQRLRSMSFPHGAWSDALVAGARAAGFDWIFTSQAALIDVSSLLEPAQTLGRIHVSEGAWTCTEGRIDPARLATFLFFRPLQRRRF